MSLELPCVTLNHRVPGSLRGTALAFEVRSCSARDQGTNSFPFTFGCMIHRFVGIGAFSAAWPSWVIRNFLAAELVKCSIQPFSIIPAIVVEPAGRRFRSKSHSGDMSNCRALRSTWVGMCEGRFGIISLLPSAQALQAGASARWLGWISRIGRRDSRQRVMSA